jgi:large subunit ribosomal protein L4
MASAAILDLEGKQTKDLPLEDAVFGAEVKPHLVHEAVRSEQAAARAGTRGAKSRGMVAGGRSKPWRQKGTGRARHGTTRAPQWTGGGVAFPPTMRRFDVKVNRKARKAALRSALSDHGSRSTVGVIDGSAFEAPSTKSAAGLLAGWGAPLPLLVVCTEEEENVAKSFRNLARVLVLEPPTIEVGALVWARSLLVTEAALPRIQEAAR